MALSAYFTGLIHPYWQEIVAGSYLIGALVTPSGTSIDADFDVTASPSQIEASLTRFQNEVKPLVPSDVADLIDSIATSIRNVLPLLAKSNTIADQDSYTIRETALHYMPETIAAYLRLPPAYRNLQPVADGKTARALLVEQLTLLDAKMREIVKNLLANDAQALVANGQFLRDRFTKESFLTTV
jgi:hypothetical protein